MDRKGVLKFLKLDGLLEHLSGYVEDRIELLKLELQEDIASVIVKTLLLGVTLIFGLSCLMFFSIASAILLNHLLEHSYSGYFIVGGIYLILTLITFSLKDNGRIKNILYKEINNLFDKTK